MGHYKTISTPWKNIGAYLTHDPSCRCAECAAERRQPKAQPRLKWFRVPVIKTALCARCEASLYPSGWAARPYDPFVCPGCRDELERQGLTTRHLKEQER